MSSSTDINPLEVFCRSLAPDESIDWHRQEHDEFCLLLEGAPSIGHAGEKVVPPTNTLFLIKPGEMHGLWNPRPGIARFWQLEFRVSSALRTHFRELFERPPEQRVLRLSAGQHQQFGSVCQKLAFERETPGVLNAVAASARLMLLLVNVTRWLTVKPALNLAEATGEIDPQCFELWQRIHQQVAQPAMTGPMLFGLDPCHDSLRHRFRKIFGISPQGMLVQLRIDRAKELLRTTSLSVKEIACELGYTRQHDLTRAFHKHTGMSPREWKTRTNGFEPIRRYGSRLEITI